MIKNFYPPFELQGHTDRGAKRRRHRSPEKPHPHAWEAMHTLNSIHCVIPYHSNPSHIIPIHERPTRDSTKHRTRPPEVSLHTQVHNGSFVRNPELLFSWQHSLIAHEEHRGLVQLYCKLMIGYGFVVCLFFLERLTFCKKRQKAIKHDTCPL